MSPFTHTCSSPTNSTKTTKLALSPSISSYLTETAFSTTIKDLMAEFKESAEESVKEIITDQYAKVDGKFENRPCHSRQKTLIKKGLNKTSEYLPSQALTMNTLIT